MDFDLNFTTMVGNQDSVPLWNSPDELYSQFIDIQEKNNQNQKKWEDTKVESCSELAHEFEAIIRTHLEVLMNLKARRSLTEDDSQICEKLQVMLREEKNTWRLVKALVKDQLLGDSPEWSSAAMDQETPGYSEEQIIANFYANNIEVRRMQAITDWLESNSADNLDEEESSEFYSESPIAWENTFHAMRANYNIDISILDLNTSRNGLEICTAMDPDAPIRTKKALAHSDKEVEIRLFKSIFKYIRAGKFNEAQNLAQRVGYFWFSAILDGWLPYSDPNLDLENLGTSAGHQPITGNKKRCIWKQSCFKTSAHFGLSTFEKAILGVLGGNLKLVLPVCNNWSDQLWARLKSSIDVKIESALQVQEFYDYQDIQAIFNTIDQLSLNSTFKEEIIHQTVQKYFILNDIDGLLEQLEKWCKNLDFESNLVENSSAVSPHFLRFFSHVILFLREIALVSNDNPRGSSIIETYIQLLIQQGSIERVAHYASFLPLENQVISFAKLLATINNPEERKQCLQIAMAYNLEIDEITQTAVELIRSEPSPDMKNTKTTPHDKRKIDSLDYLLCLESSNYIAILHHALALMRYFALQLKMEAVKETYSKLPDNLGGYVEKQWKLHTNSDITPALSENLKELDCFKVILEAQDEFRLWSEWHHSKPRPPKKQSNLSNFMDKFNYEQQLEQHAIEKAHWDLEHEKRTNFLTVKFDKFLKYPGGWMKHTPSNVERLGQLSEIRKVYIPQMLSIYVNVLQLTQRYEDCLKMSQVLAHDLHEDFTKTQIRDFLDKMSEITKMLTKLTNKDM